MWVEYVVGSRPCSERFFSRNSGFPLSSKTNISKFQFDLDTVDLDQVTNTKTACLLLFHCYVILLYKNKGTRKICQRITLYHPPLIGVLLKEDEAKTKCSGIINLLFSVLIDHTS